MHRVALGSRLFIGYFWELLKGQGFVDLGMGKLSVRLTGGRFLAGSVDGYLDSSLSWAKETRRIIWSGVTASVPA